MTTMESRIQESTRLHKMRAEFESSLDEARHALSRGTPMQSRDDHTLMLKSTKNKLESVTSRMSEYKRMSESISSYSALNAKTKRQVVEQARKLQQSSNVSFCSDFESVFLLTETLYVLLSKRLLIFQNMFCFLSFMFQNLRKQFKNQKNFAIHKCKRSGAKLGFSRGASFQTIFGKITVKLTFWVFFGQF